jgi:hypothetical protein
MTTTDQFAETTEASPVPEVTFYLTYRQQAFYLRNCRRPARRAMRTAIERAYNAGSNSITVERELAEQYVNGARRSQRLSRYDSVTLADVVRGALNQAAPYPSGVQASGSFVDDEGESVPADELAQVETVGAGGAHVEEDTLIDDSMSDDDENDGTSDQPPESVQDESNPNEPLPGENPA